MSYKLLIINFGSTSTKIAYFEDEKCVDRKSLSHDFEEIRKCSTYNDQYSMRRSAIEDYLAGIGVKLDDLDAIVTRGGQTEKIPGGAWQVNEDMLRQTKSGYYGNHVCNLGSWVAYDLCQISDHAIPLTADTPSTDEMEPIARFSGLKEIERYSCIQALNTKAMARYYAEQNNRKFEDIRVIMVMLGGGICVTAIRDGRMVDAPDGLEGEGTFSNNRCNTVPIGQLVKLCYSGQYTFEQMMRHINGEAGLMAYLGTTDLRDIMKRIENGDEYARQVIEAMCYQTSKDIGAMSTVLQGKIDAIILIGGMANVPFITEHIRENVEFIAPVVVMPGEREIEALADYGLRALRGEIPIQQFTATEHYV